ncbi:hypothetical protein PVK06_009995 [Gossypium arboreum]|uniref:Cytochrome P450 CYP749A22-like n=1 Tax=Gossypium arboreum TaxID=29729 RepID=A0ABR0QQE0_GOSAR|nr:hypothetical protein PVK06_009995 [Gossypium arboreum]
MMNSQGIKGPPYKFIYGNNKQVTKMRMEASSKCLALTDDIFPKVQPHFYTWINRYGKNYLSWSGVRAELVISDPELVKKVLRNSEKKFPKRKLSDIGEKLLGNGLAFIEGGKWAKHRKLADKAFHGERLKNMTPTIIASVETMLEKWKAQESKEIEVFEEFRLLTSEVISKTALGSNYLEGEKIFVMLKKLNILVSRNISKTTIPFINKLWKSADLLESKKLEKGIQDCVVEIIEKREDKVVGGEADSFGDDYLGLLVNAYHDLNDKNKLSLEDLVGECKTIYFAGDWQEKARREVIDIFGNPNPHLEGIPKLKTMSMIINETLRFRLHRDPYLWGDDAHLFKPERFSEGIGKATNYNAAAFSPFGLGLRSCVGMTFAMIETKIVLSMILQRYSVSLSPTYVHSPIPIISLVPQHGIQLLESLT